MSDASDGVLMSDASDGVLMADTPEGQAHLVRPYALTAGRTGTSVDIPLEASITVREGTVPRPFGDVHDQICRLCEAGPSVAEISAALDLPVGVARVLVGDLVTSGYLRVQASLTERSSIDERRDLIGRTLRGLRAL